jgi:hypothetical protein
MQVRPHFPVRLHVLVPSRGTDGRFGSRSRGYHPVAPRPLRYGPFVHRLLFRPSSPEALHVKRHERPVLVKDGIGREMTGQFGVRFRLPRKLQGSFTCHKSATWDRRLYFPSEGRHAVDFFARKIRRLRPGSNPRSSRGTTQAFHFRGFRSPCNELVELAT